MVSSKINICLYTELDQGGLFMEVKYLGDYSWKSNIINDIPNIGRVKIGVIDGPINEYLFEKFVEKRDFSNASNMDMSSIHTAAVCSIINDIAPASEIYIAQVSDKDDVPMPERNILKALQWLVTEKKVNLINMSLGFYENCKGNCNWERRFKKLKEEYKVDVIVSAGNTSEKHPGASTTCPGCSSSAITVGALDSSNKIDTRINLRSIIQEKPEVYANGHVSVKLLNDTWQGISGTSFSAPIITGLISKHYFNLNNDMNYPIALNNLKNLKSYFEDFPDIIEKLEEAITLADKKYPNITSIEKQEILDMLNELMPYTYEKTAL